MIDTRGRSAYQKWIIQPLLNLSWIRCLHPHFITLFALLSGTCIVFLLAYGFSKSVIALLILSGFLDTLDGSLARHRGISSSKGAVIDIFSDRIVEFCIIMGLYLVDPLDRGFLALCMLGSVLFCITSFLVVGIFEKQETEKSFYYSPGIMERTEAFVFFAAMILFPSYFSWLAISFTALVTFTAFFRVYQFLTNNKAAEFMQ